MNPISRLDAGESLLARPAVAPTAPPESFTLRHRHRPWVAHQKLVAVSFLGDSAVVLMALMLAYVIRFETGLREVGVVDSAISVTGYCGHVLVGSALLIFLLANSRLHDPRNFLAVRKTFAIIVKSCVIWGVGFLALALVLKIEPAISRLYCAIGCSISMAGLLGWRWFLYCVMRRESFATPLRQKTVFLGWNGECDRALKRFGSGRANQISVAGAICPPAQAFELDPPSGVPVLGHYASLRPILRSSGADLVMVVDGTLDRHQMLDLAETCGREFVTIQVFKKA